MAKPLTIEALAELQGLWNAVDVAELEVRACREAIVNRTGARSLDDLADALRVQQNAWETYHRKNLEYAVVRTR